MNGAVWLLLAALIMACLAAIPRRVWYVQLFAVLGWVLVWLNNELSHHWLDYLGLTIFGASLGVLWKRSARDLNTRAQAP